MAHTWGSKARTTREGDRQLMHTRLWEQLHGVHSLQVRDPSLCPGHFQVSPEPGVGEECTPYVERTCPRLSQARCRVCRVRANCGGQYCLLFSRPPPTRGSRPGTRPRTRQAPSPGALEPQRTPAAGLQPGSREPPPQAHPKLDVASQQQGPRSERPGRLPGDLLVHAAPHLVLLHRTRPVCTPGAGLWALGCREAAIGRRHTWTLALARCPRTLDLGKCAELVWRVPQGWARSALPRNLLAQSLGSSLTAHPGFAQ